MRNSAGEFYHIDAALDVAAGICHRLSIFRRKRSRETGELLLAKLEKLEHDTGATLRIGCSPARLSCLSVGNGVPDFRVFDERDLGLDFAGVGIEDIAEATRPPLNRLATYE